MKFLYRWLEARLSPNGILALISGMLALNCIVWFIAGWLWGRIL